MTNNILLNNSPFEFTSDYLPCFIHGAPKAGSSLFTISLVSQLYSQGNKILFLSGYHMARDEFQTQTAVNDEAIIINNQSDISQASEHLVIFVKRETPDFFKELVNELPDIKSRIILVKNFELFDESIFESVSRHEKLVLSGDIDNCRYKDKIDMTIFKSKIFFSQPITNLKLKINVIEQYQGKLFSEKMEGVIKLAV